MKFHARSNSFDKKFENYNTKRVTDGKTDRLTDGRTDRHHRSTPYVSPSAKAGGTKSMKEISVKT